MSGSSTDRDSVVVFPTALGWMAVVGTGKTLKRLAFGHRSAPEAAASVHETTAGGRRASWNPRLVRRLQAYAAGNRDPLDDVAVDLSSLTAFQQRVLLICRKIPYGKTLTYAQVAAKAGSPGAARAVGNCMAANRIPLVIPCHRVVASGGRLGGYSAPGGVETKRRLLALESRPRKRHPPRRQDRV